MARGERQEGHFEVQALVREYEQRLVVYAHRIVGDLEQARDVAQDTFLSLCREPSRAADASVGRWLFTVCRNRALDVRGKEKRMSPMASEVERVHPSPPPGEAEERREMFHTVLQAVDGLPEKQKDCLRLKFQGGLSYRQISEVTGLSESNVGFLIHRGVRRLRTRLAAQKTEGR